MRRTVRVQPAQRIILRRAWAVVIAVICGVLAFAVYGQAAQSSALGSQASQLQQENAALQSQIQERQQQVVEAQTYAWLVEEARKLGYVLPGERVFVLTGPGAPPAATGGVDAPVPTYSPPTPVPTPTPKPTPKASPTPLKFGPSSPSPSASPSA